MKLGWFLFVALLLALVAGCSGRGLSIRGTSILEKKGALQGRLSRVLPARDAVSINETILWRVEAEGGVGQYLLKRDESRFSQDNPAYFSSQYSTPGDGVSESVVVGSIGADGGILEEVTISSSPFRVVSGPEALFPDRLGCIVNVSPAIGSIPIDSNGMALGRSSEFGFEVRTSRPGSFSTTPESSADFQITSPPQMAADRVIRIRGSYGSVGPQFITFRVQESDTAITRCDALVFVKGIGPDGNPGGSSSLACRAEPSSPIVAVNEGVEWRITALGLSPQAFLNILFFPGEGFSDLVNLGMAPPLFRASYQTPGGKFFSGVCEDPATRKRGIITSYALTVNPKVRADLSSSPQTVQTGQELAVVAANPSGGSGAGYRIRQITIVDPATGETTLQQEALRWKVIFQRGGSRQIDVDVADPRGGDCSASDGHCTRYRLTVAVEDPIADHLLFVSSTLYRANLKGLSGADTICKNLAVAANLRPTRQWRALLSDSSTRVVDRALLFGDIYKVRRDGQGNEIEKTEIATRADIFNESKDLLSRPDYTEISTVVEDGVWTGTDDHGYQGTTYGTSNKHCNNWSSESGQDGGMVGNSGSLRNDWLDNENTADCNVLKRIYCISL